MDALIYTRDDEEYATLARILREEAGPIDLFRDPLDGHGHYEYAYDIVVSALEGAQGMIQVEEWTNRYPDVQVLWITGDPYFAGVAIRQRAGDFITRPYGEDRFRQAVRRALPNCVRRNQWHFSGRR